MTETAFPWGQKAANRWTAPGITFPSGLWGSLWGTQSTQDSRGVQGHLHPRLPHGRLSEKRGLWVAKKAAALEQAGDLERAEGRRTLLGAGL